MLSDPSNAMWPNFVKVLTLRRILPYFLRSLNYSMSNWPRKVEVIVSRYLIPSGHLLCKTYN